MDNNFEAIGIITVIILIVIFLFKVISYVVRVFIEVFTHFDIVSVTLLIITLIFIMILIDCIFISGKNN